jgi:HSP20 family molecular chaperone IbpA
MAAILQQVQLMIPRLQSRSAEFEAPTVAKRPLSGRTPLAMRSKSAIVIRPRALSCREQIDPIDVVERESDYEVVLPLNGVDPRKVFVIAKPQGLLIEFRLKSSAQHASGNVTETTECRILREFKLPIEIQRHTTVVHLRAGSLHIRAHKAENGAQDPWSELIHFNTRGSFGCI